MSVVLVSNLTFARPRQPEILRNVSLTIDAGEILCVLGPNGAGKSTLLKCLLGIEAHSSGGLRFADQDPRALSRRQLARLMSYVPQVSNSAFSFSVAQCVMMGRTAHIPFGREPTQSDREAVEKALQRVGLEGLQDRSVDELSGGERQLVLVARALAQDTPIILLDEPTGGLDLGNQGRVLRVIRDLAQLGRSVLMTTHLPEHAFLLGARVLLLKQGAVIASGSPSQTCTQVILSDLYDANLRVLLDDQEHSGLAACVPQL